MLGADTPLVRRTGAGRFGVGEDGGRCLALLSVLCRRPVEADMLRPIEAAAIHWASGDKALANLRLVFSGLPKLHAPADAARLQAAAYCLDNGMAPRDLMTALDLDPSVLDLVKFDPDQPRVPAGNGEESGRWTSDDGVGTPNIVPVASSGPLKPEGIEVVPSPPLDPLDPHDLNKEPPNMTEQLAIVDTLNTIRRGTPDQLKKLQPHNYQNLPDKETGAILPLDISGYKSYTTNLNGNKIRGEARLVMNGAGSKAYYTSNHYHSFYEVNIDQ